MSSYSLKKAFDKEIKKKYIGSGLFINYTKDNNKVFVKKTKGFK